MRVAADDLKYSKLARLRQAMNQVHYIEPIGEGAASGFLTRLRCGRHACSRRDRKIVVMHLVQLSRQIHNLPCVVMAVSDGGGLWTALSIAAAVASPN